MHDDGPPPPPRCWLKGPLRPPKAVTLRAGSKTAGTRFEYGRPLSSLSNTARRFKNRAGPLFFGKIENSPKCRPTCWGINLFQKQNQKRQLRAHHLGVALRRMRHPHRHPASNSILPQFPSLTLIWSNIKVLKMVSSTTSPYSSFHQLC